MTDEIDVLGPIFLYWATELHAKLRFLNAQRPSRALFCTRAGKRIKDQLDVYAEGRQDYETELFGISRISAAKAAIGRLAAFDPAFHVCNESLGADTLGAACAAFLANHGATEPGLTAELSGLNHAFTHANLRVLLAANDPAARFLRGYFDACHDALTTQVAAMSAGGRRLVLVDSGWKGSIQRLLAETCPDTAFAGLYFGVMDSVPRPERFGLMFEATAWRPGVPATAFAIHRHLIESILEPNAPSVDEISGGPCAETAAAQLAAVADETPDPDASRADAQFLAILDYTRDRARLPLDQVVADHHRALRALERILAHPTAEEARIYAGKPRSRDFGRDGFVPVFVDPAEEASAEARVARALWQPGQIALDFAGDEARARQDRVLGIGSAASYFAGYLQGEDTAAEPVDEFGWEGSVAIVTRTKDRPILFERAMRSVAAQTHRNFYWVVVNDGGNRSAVEAIIARAPIDRRRIVLISNDKSVGMEAASNLGVRAVHTEFVVIHDDDDSWHPEFLSRCTAFLANPLAKGAGFDGVLTRAWRVSEEIRDGQVIEHGRTPFQPWVNDVTLFQMAIGNFFAPISFVYRRAVYDEIGGYRESLPVLGDWRFNIEFLARTNIGFIDEYLSFYHHRDTGGAATVYQNSVIGGRSVHAEFFPVVVNDLIRDPTLPPAVAMVLAQAHPVRILEHRFNMVDDKLRGLEARLDALTAEAALPEPPALTGLQPADRRHIVACLAAALRDEPDEAQRQAMEAALARSHELDDPGLRAEVVQSFAARIGSPRDFDHLAYLQRRPDIWATEFNGFDGVLPYHHYLIHGIAQGEPRPTRT